MHMNRRTVLPALLVLLLLLPLVWLGLISMSGLGARMPLSQGKPIVPMLSREERLRLTTYAHDCGTDADCETQLRCVYDGRTARQHCTDSSCAEDEHCPNGFACIPFGAVNGKELVRVCSILGVRKEGEVCESQPSEPQEACARGLLCQGFCGRPCRVEDPASCPEGYSCHEGSEGASCLPACEGLACPADQRCVRLMGGHASACMTIHGQDCERTPCAQGLHCTRNTYPTTPGEIWMECLRDCGENEAPCPEGTVCSLYQCRKSCDPQDSSSCGPGFSCGRNHPNMPWACVPGSRSRSNSRPREP